MANKQMIKGKFELSDVVEATETYRKQFPPPYRGTVTGICRDPNFVRITKTDQKIATKHHIDFWYVARRDL